MSQSGELSAKSSISGWDLADHGVGDFAGRIRTFHGDILACPSELTGLVRVATAYTLFLLVPAFAGRSGQQRRQRSNPREDRTKP